MSSAWGLENRCPFLDKRIIEFAFSLDIEQKIQGYTTKVLLRNILKRRNPAYVDEEKKGLFCSVNEWIGSPLKYEKTDWVAFQQNIWKNFQ